MARAAPPPPPPPQAPIDVNLREDSPYVDLWFNVGQLGQKNPQPLGLWDWTWTVGQLRPTSTPNSTTSRVGTATARSF